MVENDIVDSATDDLDQAGGKGEQIVGLLQQKYGYTREDAEQEFNRRLKEAKL